MLATRPTSVHAGTSAFMGDDDAEQRHGRGGAEAGRAAQRIAGDHDHAAIGDLERGKERNGELRAATRGAISACGLSCTITAGSATTHRLAGTRGRRDNV